MKFDFFLILVKIRLQNEYKTVAERIISMALESVDYSEEKACQILNIVMQEDDNLNKIAQSDQQKINGENGGCDGATTSHRYFFNFIIFVCFASYL